MNYSNQPFPQQRDNQPLQEKYQFTNQSDDDRRDEEIEKLKEELEEQSGDWGDIDPAGGEEPTAPGSAV